MKKTLLLLSVLGTLNTHAQDIKKIGATHIMYREDNTTHTSYVYYTNDSIKEFSYRNIKIEDAFPDGVPDSTKDGIIFELTSKYYCLYLRRTGTKYTCINKTGDENTFFENFLRNVEIIRRNSECYDFNFK